MYKKIKSVFDDYFCYCYRYTQDDHANENRETHPTMWNAFDVVVVQDADGIDQLTPVADGVIESTRL